MISVCMAVYNGEKYIKKQIDSIISQLDTEDELIISDDGSTDDTLGIIESYKDKRIKLLSHQQKKYLLKIKKSRNFYLATSNFENALLEAKGDYIFLSDQDDIWKPAKVSKIMAELKKNDIVMSNFSVMDMAENVYVDNFYDFSPISNFLVVNILKSKFLGCCMAFRRNVLEYVLPFPKKLIAHDYWIGCLGVKKFSFAFIDESLLLYRRTASNVSTSTGKSNNSIVTRFVFRFVFLCQLIFRLVTK